jgi:hypothetical protein
MGEQSGAHSPVAGVILGASQSSGLLNVKIKLAGSLAWGRVDFDATGEHTSGVRPGRRGMETAKYGHDNSVNPVLKKTI